MPVRQMKSMSGLRRFVSDYGFEGFFRPPNLALFMNGLLYTIGSGTITFTACVWLNRGGDPMPLSTLARWTAHGPLDGRNSTDHFWKILSKCLAERKCSISDLQRAARHLAPIESRIAEALAFFAALRDAVCRNPGTHFSALVKDLGCVNLGRPVCDMIASASSTAKNMDDLEQAVCRALVSDWVRAGYFDENTYPKRDVFGNRQSSEAVAVDIGSMVNSEPSTNPYITGERCLMEVVKSVQQWGFAVIKQAICTAQLEKITTHLLLAEDAATKIGERIVTMDKNISHSRALPNRLQMLIRGSSLEGLFQDIHASIAPVITSLLDRKSSSPSRIMLSDIRLIVVDFAADKGNWTIMNGRGGYTVLIPLHDRDNRAGTQVLVPGSHFLGDSVLPWYRRIYFAAMRYRTVKRPVAVSELYEDGCWSAGDALLLDNKLLHRAHENRRFKSGTYLLLKYETHEEAPVGLYWAGKFTYRLAGFLERVTQWSYPTS